jgi:hypothetical protein
MSCELEQPDLTPQQRRQYHALIQFLAARLVTKNRNRKRARGEPPLRVQAMTDQPAHQHEHHDRQRPALAAQLAQPDEHADLLARLHAQQREPERVRNPNKQRKADEQ